jgi:uncharacterized protein (TIGR03000 family)
MRKSLLILGLVAITLATSASDAFAQRRGGGNWGNGYGNGYYGSPYYGRGYYNNYGYPGYYYGGLGIGLGLGNYGSRGYYSSPSYYYGSAPNYSYSDTVTVPPANYRQSFYTDPNAATINVIVPTPDAQVWFDDSATSQRGMERNFQTPSLSQAGTYTIRAVWTESGRTVDRQRQIRVQPGQLVTVDFRGSATE